VNDLEYGTTETRFPGELAEPSTPTTTRGALLSGPGVGRCPEVKGHLRTVFRSTSDYYQ
jgi:hypothetical protein